jgi:hypothetical protein
MEDVLEVYHRPHDPQRPVVCLDEGSRQLIGEVRPPLPPRPAKDDRPGRAECYDCEYVRNGTANLFMAFEPLGGWREVAVTDQRRREDGARFVRDLKLPRFGGRFRGWRIAALFASAVRSKWASDTRGPSAAGWDCRSLR